MLHPDRFVAGGEALARADDGKVVFVRGAVPDDTVAVSFTERRKDWSRAVVRDVIAPGPSRVTPPCAARRAGCGGCDWQHVAYSDQLAHKTAIVADALRRTARLDQASIAVGAAVPAAGYRTTVRVVGGPDKRPAFRMERSADTVGFETCPVAHPRLNEALATLHIDPGVEVTVRVSDESGEATAYWDRTLGDVTGFPAWVATGSDASLTEDVGDRSLVVSAASFFQSGPLAAALIVDAVQRAAPELSAAATVVDAYSGVGLLGVCATSAPTRVIAIESSRTANRDAAQNFHDRAVDLVRAEVGDWRFDEQIGTVDVVIADPARTGLGKPGTTALANTSAPVLVLVSCDPAALARDTTVLAARHYRHVHTEVLDTFPMTHHVEAVSRFERVES